MIELRRGDLLDSTTEALIREIDAEGTSRTSVGRRTEVRIGEKNLARLEQMRGSPVGTALLTPAGELPTSFVLHLIVSSMEEPMTVRSVERGLRNALRRAADFGIDSLALPPLGFGVGIIDAESTAQMLVDVLAAHAQGGEPPTALEIVVETEYEEEIFRRAIDAVAESL